MALLRFDSKLRKGEAVALTQNKIVFGRHLSCDCLLNHPTVSREHFFIERNGEKFFVVDQESGNGTFVNGERISWVELKDGDLIKAGPFLLRAELSGQVRPASMTPAERQNEEFDEEIERAYANEYLDGIRLFNAGRYFEAHEAWEEIWQHSSDETKLFYQMLIQAAVCLYHYQNGNARGTLGMYERVVDKLAHLPAEFMSLNLIDFSRQFRSYLASFGDEQDESLAGEKPRPQIRLRLSEAETLEL
jgi:hypothetical protein